MISSAIDRLFMIMNTLNNVSLWLLLPDLVRGIVCGDFLSLKDVASFDSACTQAESRTALLHCLKNPRFSEIIAYHAPLVCKYLVSDFIEWIYLRQCRVQALTITIEQRCILQLDHVYAFIESVLVVSSEPEGHGELERSAITKLLHVYPQLKKLTLNYANAIMAIESLQCLINAPAYIHLTDIVLDGFCEKEVISDALLLTLLQRYQTTLQSFQLPQCSSVVFQFLCTHCQELKELHVDISGSISKGEFLDCISHCGANLEVFQVSRLPLTLTLFDEDMLMIANSMTKLREFTLFYVHSLFGISFFSLLHFLTHCPQLTAISFMDSFILHRKEFKHFKRGESMALIPIKQVQKDKFYTSLSLGVDWDGYTEAEILEILQLLPPIHQLHLDEECCVQPTALCAAVRQSKHINSLESLRLNITTVLKNTDNFFTLLLHDSPHLTHLVIDNTARRVPQSLQGATQIQRLIENVCGYCQKVERFFFYPGCPSMSSSDFVCRLITHMPVLRALYLGENMQLRKIIGQQLKGRKVDLEHVVLQVGDAINHIAFVSLPDRKKTNVRSPARCV
ncbi:hypothetical protein EON65_35620 [archaeon]|nr:MAG: hypothetical protein EON65_35620 [archaeon]